MRRTVVSLLASLMATAAFGLDLRLVSPATVEVLDSAGNGLISFTGVNLRYPKSQFFKNGTATAVDGGFEVTYAPPASFPSDYTLPQVTGRFVKSGDDVVVSYRLSGVAAADSFSPTLSMIGRKLGTGVKRGEGLSNGGRWTRDPSGGQPSEEPLGMVVSYTNAVSGFIIVYVRGQEPNLSWQDTSQAHIDFVAGEEEGEWRTGFTLCDGDRSAFAMANAAVGKHGAVSISTPCLYNLFEGRRPLEFSAKVENATVEQRTLDVSWWVRDFAGRTVVSGHRSAVLGPYGCEPVAATFDPDEDRGLYFVEVSAVDGETGEESFARTNLARLPPYEFSSTPETSPFGIAAYWPIPDEESVQKLMDRMGVRWVRGGDTRLQHPPRRANRHSSANVQTLKGEERTAWIEEQLAACRANGNEYWEFGNEFNMSSAGIAMEGNGIGKALLCEDYVGFVRDIVRIKDEKGYDDVHLLSLGLAGHDTAFIRGIWERGAWGLLEGFCLHPGRGNFTADYPYRKPERAYGVAVLTEEDGTEKLKNPNFWSFLGAVRASQRQIASYGDMPLWLTEVYTPTYPNSSWNDTLRASAENTMLTYALTKADGVKCAFYYQLFDSVWYDKLGANPRDREYFFGLLNRDLSPKPAFMAYCAIAEELDGAACLGWVKMPNGTSHALLFTKKDGDFLVAWDRTEGYVLTHDPPNGQKYCSPEPWEEHWTTATEVEIPVVKGPQTVNAIGQARPVSADRFNVARIGLTGAPVIVRNVDRARLEIVGASAWDVFPDREKLVVHAPMDERGERPLVRDLSGAGRAAPSSGNVTGGRTSNATCLQGFTSTQSQIIFTNVVENWSRNWSFVCWVRNPDLAASGVRLIARGGGNASHPDGSGSDNGWQVWIDADGRVRIGFQNWNGGQTASEADVQPVVWKQDVWYQIAVVFSFKTVGDMRYKTASAYVTEAGGATIGPPVAVLTMDSAPGLGVSKNLIIGAAGKGYYGTAMPSGCFAGDMCQAWLFLKTLTADELLSDVRAFRSRHHAIEDFAKLYWKLDETGVTPTAKDATGNGFDGVSAGGVSGGLAAPRGTSYGGFSSLGSDLCVTLDSAQYFQNGNRNDIVLWVKRPQPTASSTALLAGNMKVHADPGSSQPWRVYVTDTGAVGVSMQSWNGFVSKTVGEPYDWGDAWHLVVIRFDRPKMTVPEGQSVCNRIRVSAAPATRAGVRNGFRLLVEGVQLRNNSLLESGANLVFGSAGSGYYREFQPKSVLGAGGRLGEVVLAVGGWFDWDWLSAQLTRYCGPGEGLSVILK